MHFTKSLHTVEPKTFRTLRTNPHHGVFLLFDNSGRNYTTVCGRKSRELFIQSITAISRSKGNRQYEGESVETHSHAAHD